MTTQHNSKLIIEARVFVTEAGIKNGFKLPDGNFSPVDIGEGNTPVNVVKLNTVLKVPTRSGINHWFLDSVDFYDGFLEGLKEGKYRSIRELEFDFRNIRKEQLSVPEQLDVFLGKMDKRKGILENSIVCDHVICQWSVTPNYESVLNITLVYMTRNSGMSGLRESLGSLFKHPKTNTLIKDAYVPNFPNALTSLLEGVPKDVSQ